MKIRTRLSIYSLIAFFSILMITSCAEKNINPTSIVPVSVVTATPTIVVGQLVTLSGRINVTLVDFTGEIAAVSLIDDAGNTFELQKPLPTFSFDDASHPVNIVGRIISIVSVAKPKFRIYAVVKVELLSFGN